MVAALVNVMSHCSGQLDGQRDERADGRDGGGGGGRRGDGGVLGEPAGGVAEHVLGRAKGPCGQALSRQARVGERRACGKPSV